MTADPAHEPPTPPGLGPRPGVLVLNWRDTTHPEGGGSEVFVERVAAGLAAQGRPVTLFCAAHPGAPASERVGDVRVVRRGGRLTVYLHAWWAHLTGRLGGHEVVVDVQNGMPFFAALWCRRPLVVLVHHVHREQWRVVMPPLQARVGWWVESRLAPRATGAPATSPSPRRPGGSWSASASRPPRSPWSTTARPCRPGRGRPPPYPSVCVLGRLVPHKRVELALEAAARIRPHLPELKVLVVGQGYWEPRLRETVDRLGLQDAVELLGWVDEETKQRVLASSWALAMPSVKEGWGLAVLEAAASGTPTVAFRAAGGLRESVVHGTPACSPTTRRSSPATWPGSCSTGTCGSGSARRPGPMRPASPGPRRWPRSRRCWTRPRRRAGPRTPGPAGEEPATGGRPPTGIGR